MKATRLTLALSGPADDVELRRLLRETRVPGSVTLSYEREPSFARAAAVEGRFHQTVVARDTETNEVVGMACRSVSDRYVGGAPVAIGYLSQLRASRRFEWGAGGARVLRRGLLFLRRLHQDGRTPYYLISLVDGNAPATRLLTAGLPGYPPLRSVGRMVTYALLVGRRRSPAPPRDVVVRRAGPEHLDDIVACLARHGVRHHLAPVWTSRDLTSDERTPGLTVTDFHVALRGNAMVGCLARWDQRAIKQAVVRGYGPPLDRWRWVVNGVARLLGYAQLPAAGSRLEQSYASHLAIDGDAPDVFVALLGAVHDDSAASGDGLLVFGLPEIHQLARVVRGYRCFKYPSELYMAAWDPAALPMLDHRPVWPEIAVL